MATTGTFTPNVRLHVAHRRSFTQTIWVLVDTNGDRANDVSPPATTAVQIDLDAAAGSDQRRGRHAGNEAVNVSWDKLDFATDDGSAGYQVLCQRGGGLQVFPDDTFTPRQDLPDDAHGDGGRGARSRCSRARRC